jgi:hypothetical protein
MLLEILSRVFVYSYLFLAVAVGSIVESPIKLFVMNLTKFAAFVKRLGFHSNWAIFTGMTSQAYEIEIIATLKSGKILKWFLSDDKNQIGTIKIYNKTVLKNTHAFFIAYKYYIHVIEENLLNYAFDVLKDPMVDLKMYIITFEIDANIDYFLRKQKRPKPNAPPKIGYEAKWEY